MGIDAFLTILTSLSFGKCSNFPESVHPGWRNTGPVHWLSNKSWSRGKSNYWSRPRSSCLPFGSMERTAFVFAVRQVNLACQGQPGQNGENC